MGGNGWEHGSTAEAGKFNAKGCQPRAPGVEPKYRFNSIDLVVLRFSASLPCSEVRVRVIFVYIYIVRFSFLAIVCSGSSCVHCTGGLSGP